MLALLVWEWRSERHSQICALKCVPGKKVYKRAAKKFIFGIFPQFLQLDEERSLSFSVNKSKKLEK